MQEPVPKPRALDQLMDLYVRIGSYMGGALAVVVFSGTCMLSYMLFQHTILTHGYLLLGFILACATLVIASVLAVGVFFWASVMWLPTLLALWLLLMLGAPLLARLHHHL